MRIDSFNRHAREYASNSSVQAQVAQTVASYMKPNYKRILDIGAGTGALYNALLSSPHHFVALDGSLEMLNLHPISQCITKLCENFDAVSIKDIAKTHNIECIVSASSLQWSYDFNKIFLDILTTQRPFVLALFTSNTFRNLHETLGIYSPIVSKETIETIIKSHKSVTYRYENITQEFENTKAALRHISKSGIAGASMLANVNDLRRIIKEDKIKALDYEVVYISNITV